MPEKSLKRTAKEAEKFTCMPGSNYTEKKEVTEFIVKDLTGWSCLGIKARYCIQKSLKNSFEVLEEAGRR